jgi:dephospho-CoA kinase
VIYRVGLTGGLGAGKSTVARRLEALGIPVLDADRVVHELYRPDGKGTRAVAEEFGERFLDATGSVDRPALAGRVFGDEPAVKRLNARIHPLVLEALTEWYRELERRGEPIGVVEATLLLEAGGRARYDYIVTVSAPEDARIARVLSRDAGATEAKVRSRLAAQLTDAERDRQSDLTLWNDGSPGDLLAAADHLAERLRENARRRGA